MNDGEEDKNRRPSKNVESRKEQVKEEIPLVINLDPKPIFDGIETTREID